MNEETQTGNTALGANCNLEDLTTQSNVSVFIKKPRQFEWEPKEDITPYELALCVAVLILAIHGMSGEAYDQLPEKAKRHFVEK